MSPHTVNNFVSDLVLMAQAVEELPKVREELDKVMDVALSRLDKISSLEADLQQAKDYAASLEAKVRATEAQRDDAELSFLEADERTSRALDFIKATFGNAGSLIQALEPPKPEPVVEAKVESASPLPGTSSVSEQAATAETHTASHLDIAHSAPQGQSEPDPTVGMETSQSPVESSGSGTQSSTDTTSSASWATPTPQPDTPPQPKPYEGKRWSEMNAKSDHYIAHDEWLNGGGSPEGWNQ